MGSTHDNKLWQKYPPPLAPRERWLGDRAYTAASNETTIAMYLKQQHGTTLKPWQKAHNAVHAWYRSTVEHTIGEYYAHSTHYAHVPCDACGA
jgi:hypothetical protein